MKQELLVGMEKGKLYHRPDCPLLKFSKPTERWTSQRAAFEAGRIRCKTCITNPTPAALERERELAKARRQARDAAEALKKARAAQARRATRDRTAKKGAAERPDDKQAPVREQRDKGSTLPFKPVAPSHGGGDFVGSLLDGSDTLKRAADEIIKGSKEVLGKPNSKAKADGKAKGK